MQRRVPDVMHTPFGFYPIFAYGAEVILRNSCVPFQGAQMPDVVYRIARSNVEMGPYTRRLCGVGPCDAVCELHSVHPTTVFGLHTRSLYVQQNLVGADFIVHVRYSAGRRARQIIACHVGSRVMSHGCETGTVIALNRRSVRIIRDDGSIVTWRLRSIAEVA